MARALREDLEEDWDLVDALKRLVTEVFAWRVVRRRRASSYVREWMERWRLMAAHRISECYTLCLVL